MDNYLKAIQILKEYHQEHIKHYIDKSDKDKRNKLIEQILHIDFLELRELYRKTFEELYVDLEELIPVTGVNPDNISSEKIAMYNEIGTNIIKSNKFAVSTMAGGQGTRLRFCKG